MRGKAPLRRVNGAFSFSIQSRWRKSDKMTADAMYVGGLLFPPIDTKLSTLSSRVPYSLSSESESAVNTHHLLALTYNNPIFLPRRNQKMYRRAKE